MTRLRKMMLEELQRRNYSQLTTKAYIRTVVEFAQYFHRSPEEFGPEHVREFQAHLFTVRKLSANSVSQRTAALRFLFVKTLKRAHMLEHIPFPKVPVRLPTVLSPDEVARLIESANNPSSELCSDWSELRSDGKHAPPKHALRNGGRPEGTRPERLLYGGKECAGFCYRGLDLPTPGVRH